MNKITFVSSFINIGRGEWNNGYSRTEENYINNFMSFYSNIELDLILFCEENTKKCIESKIDNNFKTNIKYVLIQKNEIEYLKYSKEVEQIQNSQSFKSKLGRDSSNPPEYSKPEYVLMMFAKTEFLKRAKEEKIISHDTNILCWIDFGIGHGNDSYINSIKNRKIKNIETETCIFFSRQNITPVSDPNFYFSMSDNVIICGGIFLIPLSQIEFFFEKFKQIVNDLISQELIDDDQTILSIFVSKHKKICTVIDSRKYRSNPHGGDWFPVFELLD